MFFTNAGFWIIILIMSTVIEIATASLVSIWFIAGALVALLLTYFKFSLGWQIGAFIVVSILSFIILRPWILKYVRSPKVATNSDMLIGKMGEVIEEIGEIDAGKVKVDGQIWTARSNTGHPIKRHELVIVERIQGVRLIVRKRS